MPHFALMSDRRRGVRVREEERARRMSSLVDWEVVEWAEVVVGSALSELSEAGWVEGEGERWGRRRWVCVCVVRERGPGVSSESEGASAAGLVRMSANGATLDGTWLEGCSWGRPAYCASFADELGHCVSIRVGNADVAGASY